MQSFNELYGRLVKAAAENRTEEELEQIRKEDFDPHHLDCLFRPEKHAPVWRIGECGCGEDAACAANCLFDALKRDEKGNMTVDRERCVGCGECIERCNAKNLIESRDILPALAAVNRANGPVYALVAPAFIGQLAPRHAWKAAQRVLRSWGFPDGGGGPVRGHPHPEGGSGVRPDHPHGQGFSSHQLLLPHLDRNDPEGIPSAGPQPARRRFPMVACGRAVKKLEPDATTIFVGPCVAKKAEAREPDVADAV